MPTKVQTCTTVATLVTAYMQPKYSKTLGSFDLRFRLCFFIIYFGHVGDCAHRDVYLCKSAANIPDRKGGATLVTT